MGCLTLMVLLTVPCAEIVAQTRKSGTTKTAASKTAASKKAPAKKAPAKSAPAGKPVSLNGNYYEGLLKFPGQPMDGFCTFKFDESGVLVNIAAIAQVPLECSASEAAGKILLKITGNCTGTLTSRDNGSSFDGRFTFGDQKTQVWVVKVNENHETPTMEDSELAAIIGNPDGYTGFFLFVDKSMVGCIPTEVTMNDDSTFSFTLDNATLQQLFKKEPLGYKIVDKKMVVTLPGGYELSGNIYDDGTYISIPFGRQQGGTDIALFLIR